MTKPLGESVIPASQGVETKPEHAESKDPLDGIHNSMVRQEILKALYRGRHDEAEELISRHSKVDETEKAEDQESTDKLAA